MKSDEEDEDRVGECDGEDTALVPIIIITELAMSVQIFQRALGSNEQILGNDKSIGLHEFTPIFGSRVCVGK